MGFTLSRIYEYATANIRDQELAELDLYSQRVSAQFDSLAQIALTTANLVSRDEDLSEDDLYGLMLDNVANNPLVYGAAIAFEPFAWQEDTRLIAPYAFGEGEQLSLMDIGADSYDYSDGSWDWFSSPREFGQAVWTDPYFDEGAGDVLMTTFSAPFYRNGNFAGVATVDVRLDALQEDTALQLGDRNFMMVSHSGRFISHFNPDVDLNTTIQEHTALHNDPGFSAAVDQMLSGSSGVGTVRDLFLDGQVIAGETFIFYTPVDSTGWTLASIIPNSDMTAELRQMIQLGIYGLLFMVALIIILTLFVSARLSRPIKQLSAAVSDVARGKLDTSIEKIQSMDELGKLSVGFNRMLKNLKKQMEIQSQQTAARQIVEKELQMARETQQALLPTDFPPFPERKEFQLHAINKAAQHVAGDFFDFFLISPKQLVFVIADVSGKGMAAALVMAVTRTIVRNLAQSGKTPAAILAETNELLRESHGGSAFVTIFLGIYNTANGRIVYANGGHSPSLRIARNGQVTSQGTATGTIVGMLENQEYTNAEMRLGTGETLLLYTDGLSEARSPAGEFFGEGRIRSFLEDHAQTSPADLCNYLEKHVCQFQEMNLADDLTILALKRSSSAMDKLISGLMGNRNPQMQGSG